MIVALQFVELTALERGMRALHSGMDVKAYAESVGRARTSVWSEVLAARVADAVTHAGHDLSAHFKALVEIDAAPAGSGPPSSRRWSRMG